MARENCNVILANLIYFSAMSDELNIETQCILCKRVTVCRILNDKKAWLCNDCKRALEKYNLYEPKHPKPIFDRTGIATILIDYILNPRIVGVAYIIGFVFLLILLNYGEELLPTVFAILILFALIALVSLPIIALILNVREYQSYRRKLADYSNNIEGLIATYEAELNEYNLIKYIYDYWPEYPPDWTLRRIDVIKRDNYQCLRCKQSRTRENPLQVHHIIKLKDGGSNKLDNLITLCVRCHSQEPGHEHMLYNQSTAQDYYAYRSRRRRY